MRISDWSSDVCSSDLQAGEKFLARFDAIGNRVGGFLDPRDIGLHLGDLTVALGDFDIFRGKAGRGQHHRCSGGKRPSDKNGRYACGGKLNPGADADVTDTTRIMKLQLARVKKLQDS